MKDGSLLRVLHIEDDLVDRMAFKRFIKERQLPYQLTTAASLSEAREKLLGQSYDAVVTDYFLGDGTSLELLPLMGHLPVIFTTATGTESVAVQAMKQGASDYLIKDPDRHYLEMLPTAVAFAMETFRVRQESRMLLDALTNTSESVVVTDPVGRIRFVNRAFETQYGFESSEVLGVTFDFLWRRLPERFEEGEYEHVRKNGSVFPVHAARSASGSVEAPVLAYAFRDLSENKRAEREISAALAGAEAASRAKGDFLAMMSHEIRTPLNAIIGMAELLEVTELNAIQRTYVESFRDAGSHLLDVINSVLDFSQIEAGRLNIESVAMRIDETVSEAVRVFDTKARQAGLRLVVRQSSCERTVRGDPLRLRQVLMNLVGNAVKFTAEGQVTVQVDCSSAGNWCHARFQVIDTGPGVSAEAQESILEPFAQADTSITRQFGGSGLGLSISAQLVGLMGGKLAVHSVLGQGATFEFTLRFPCELRGGDPAVQEAAGATTRPLSILLVEDNPANEMLFLALIGETSHTVTTAADGVECLERLAERTFDLVLMDLEMPRMDGYEATRRARELETSLGRPRTRIVALTAHALSSAAERAREAGCDGHLTKPIQRKTLVEFLAGTARSTGAPPVES